MKVILSLTLYCCLALSSFSQNLQNTEERPHATLSSSLITTDIVFPGVGYERRILPRISLKLNTGIVPRFGYGRDDPFFYLIESSTSLQGRYYYNLDTRAAYKKNILKNSANYVGVKASIYAPMFSSKTINSYKLHPQIAAFWGMQRSYNRWLFNIDFGLQYIITKSEVSPSIFFPSFGINFGYILFEKR